MTLTLLHAKLHHLRVTQADLEYLGSLTIDEDLMDAVGLRPYEKILVANLDDGHRFETYAIPGVRGSRIACLNGAAARKVQPGDIVIIMAYALMTPEEAREFTPAVVFPDTATNKLI